MCEGIGFVQKDIDLFRTMVFTRILLHLAPGGIPSQAVVVYIYSCYFCISYFVHIFPTIFVNHQILLFEVRDDSALFLKHMLIVFACV